MLETGHSVEQDITGRWHQGQVVQRTHQVHVHLDPQCGQRVVYLDTNALLNTEDEVASDAHNTQACQGLARSAPGLMATMGSSRAQRVRNAMAAVEKKKLQAAAIEQQKLTQQTLPAMIASNPVLQGKPSATLVPRGPLRDHSRSDGQRCIDELFAPSSKPTLFQSPLQTVASSQCSQMGMDIGGD